MADDLLIYIGQKAFIEKDGQVLVLIVPKLGLDFPGGKIQEGEKDFLEALRREVREETNLEIEIGEPFVTWRFDFGPDHLKAGKKIYMVGFKCKYLSGDVRLSDEHSEFYWVNKENYREVDPKSNWHWILDKYFLGG